MSGISSSSGYGPILRDKKEKSAFVLLLVIKQSPKASLVPHVSLAKNDLRQSVRELIIGKQGAANDHG